MKIKETTLYFATFKYSIINFIAFILFHSLLNDITLNFRLKFIHTIYNVYSLYLVSNPGLVDSFCG